jgi:predicted Rossmann-fold nucleotide-binding protein
MGGHGEKRDTATLPLSVEIARKLTRSGCLVASGGGPGAMEATHLGALLADAPDSEVARAVDRLKSYPKLPQNTMDVVADDGTVNETILGELHAWAKPAYEIGVENAERGGTSLAIPTWYYGHEPISPLASHVAKYFQNSIREDVLLAMAANGIIYTQGAAGTLQEVFQDAAQNFYRKPNEPFAPMVFFGKDFWTTKLPAVPLLKALFTSVGKMTEAEFRKYVVITDSVD